MHALEKILASNGGASQVKTGEIIKAKIDLAEINDLYLQTIYSFYEMGGKRFGIRNRFVLFLTTIRSPYYQNCRNS